MRDLLSYILYITSGHESDVRVMSILENTLIIPNLNKTEHAEAVKIGPTTAVQLEGGICLFHQGENRQSSFSNFFYRNVHSAMPMTATKTDMSILLHSTNWQAPKRKQTGRLTRGSNS